MQGRRTLVATVALATLVLTACQGGDVDKAGGDTVVLRLASIDPVNDNGQSYGPQAFIDSLTELSEGTLQVEVIEGYGEGAPDAESRIVEAIAKGELDGGWPSVRAFADAGIHGLEAVEAPMTITNYEAEKALVSSPVAEDLLATLDGSGVVGLSMTVGPLRRPVAAEGPLLGPEDWQGVRFRVFNSPVQEEAVRALGAEPANLGTEWVDEVLGGTLRGAEFDIAQHATNGIGAEVGNITGNVVLWPKVFVLTLSQERYDALTEEQRGWVEQAAANATQVSVDAEYDETSLARDMCGSGVRFHFASDAQVADLRAAFAPVVASLADDPTTGPLLEQIQAIAAEHPAVEQPDVPAECREGFATPTGLGVVPEEIPDIPDGVYRVELTLEDLDAAGVSNEGGFTGTWSMLIENGRWEITCRPLEPGRDCGGAVTNSPLEMGELRGTEDTVYMLGDEEAMSAVTGCALPPTGEEGHCYPLFDYVLTYSLDGDELTLTDAGVIEGPFDAWVLEPWTKIE